MRVAIVHYWLVSMRGGEKVLEALCELYPDADIFTLVLDEAAISPTIRRHRITTSFLQRLPGARKHYQSLLPLMPWAVESFDLRGYDLVLSSESGPAKAVIAPPHALHVCYCHSPMRYVWDHYHAYREGAGTLSRVAMSVLAPLLRIWDVTSSARVDLFVANSHHVAARIDKYYRRPASVVHPPVDVEAFASEKSASGDFYLCAGQLVAYKRVDLAVAACTATGRKLVVVGEGPERRRLEAMAGPTVTFLGRAEDDVMRDHIARCRALLFPGEEDFGIVPVEAMAAGRPVIAYGAGGALETVVNERTGFFFDHQTVPSLVGALEQLEATLRADGPSLDPAAIAAHARGFDAATFKSSFSQIVARELANRRRPQLTHREAVRSAPFREAAE